MKIFSFLFVLLVACTVQAHDKDTTYDCGSGPHEIIIRTKVICTSTQPDPVREGRFHVRPERVYEDGPCFTESAETWSDWPGCEGAEKNGANYGANLTWVISDDGVVTY